MKVSDYIATTLEKNGVSVVFEMIGGMITHIIDSLHQKTKINIGTANIKNINLSII